jgi:uncharacterized protein YprB with RNaseH-like and TPR domain
MAMEAGGHEAPGTAPDSAATAWQRRLAAAAAIGGDPAGRAHDLLRRLLLQHPGASVPDALPGAVRQATPEGFCWQVESSHPGALTLPDRRRAEAGLAEDLELVPGIGPHRAAGHRRHGRRVLADLAGDARYGGHVARVQHAVRAAPGEAFRLARGRRGASHPTVWWTSGLFQPSDLVFLDIETLGLGGEAVVLSGILEGGADGLHITQYLAGHIDDEPALLAATLRHVAAAPALVSFNGRSFDLPVLRRRAAYYGLDTPPPPAAHYDLLPFSRRAWRGQVTCFEAAVLEHEVLGRSRPDDLPGAWVPRFYDAYRTTGSAGPLVYICDHNRRDLLGMVEIFRRLGEAWQ